MIQIVYTMNDSILSSQVFNSGLLTFLGLVHVDLSCCVSHTDMLCGGIVDSVMATFIYLQCNYRLSTCILWTKGIVLPIA